MKVGDNTPVACSLTTAEWCDREATLVAQFKPVVIEIDELQEGYAFQHPGGASGFCS